MLFATERERPDTGIDISHLMTRVREPDQNYWLNMVHLFKYARDNKYLPQNISSDNSVVLNWYSKGSHVVHPNIRGETGGRLKMGRGLPISLSATV